MKNYCLDSFIEEPTRRIILGLTIALDGAIAESQGEEPHDYRPEISKLLKSVWKSLETKEKMKQFKIKYQEELSPCTSNATVHFYQGVGSDWPRYFTIEDEDGETEEFTLDTTSPKTLRQSIIKSVEEWTRRRNPSSISR